MRVKGVERRGHNGTEPEPLNGLDVCTHSKTHRRARCSCEGGQTLERKTETWRKRARSELWRIRRAGLSLSPLSYRWNQGPESEFASGC